VVGRDLPPERIWTVEGGVLYWFELPSWNVRFSSAPPRTKHLINCPADLWETLARANYCTTSASAHRRWRGQRLWRPDRKEPQEEI